MIPHFKPWITSADLEAVTTILESGMIARGTQVADLKVSIAVYVGSVRGIAISSGTAALTFARYRPF